MIFISKKNEINGGNRKEFIAEDRTKGINEKAFISLPLTMLSCLNGHLIHPIVQYLIEKGAKIQVKDENQRTPLYNARGKVHLHHLVLILKKESM